jgi:hypothetical protein
MPFSPRERGFGEGNCTLELWAQAQYGPRSAASGAVRSSGRKNGAAARTSPYKKTLARLPLQSLERGVHN